MRMRIKKVKKIREIKGHSEEQGFQQPINAKVFPVQEGKDKLSNANKSWALTDQRPPDHGKHFSDDEAQAADKTEEQLQNAAVSAEEKSIVFSDQI